MQQFQAPTSALSFELLAEIAVGATATVELCRLKDGPLAGELVAVKRLHPHIAEDQEFVDMFRDEIWMAQALKHKHVARVVGWGEDEYGRYLASEFIRGVSLQRLMKTVFATGEEFGERMIVYLASAVCGGLAEAHVLCGSDGELLDLVHRDLTPGNILLGFAGEVAIIDFGLAKAKQRLTRTMTGVLKGKPLYMAPEQLLDEGIDVRTDVFALGVVMFELFSGQRPWPGSGQLDIMRAMTELPPADLQQFRPDIDRVLAKLVARCLARDPTDRYQSALELREDLFHWLRTHGYQEGNPKSLSRFVRRNAMRQMRWFDRAVAGVYAEQTCADRDARVAEAPIGFSEPEPLSSRVPVSLRPPESTRSPATSPDAHEEEWGDDGPTLIQSHAESRRVGAAIRGPRPRVSSDATTRQGLAAVAVDKAEPAQTETLVAVRADVAAALLDDTDQTVELSEGVTRAMRAAKQLGDGVAGAAPSLSATPELDFGGVSAAPVTTEGDYGEQARLVAELAQRLAVKASRARDVAVYAAEAADLAAEASRLARRGQHDIAASYYAQMQFVVASIERGRAPRRRRQLEGTDARLLSSEQIVTLSVVFAVAIVCSTALAVILAN